MGDDCTRHTSKWHANRSLCHHDAQEAFKRRIELDELLDSRDCATRTSFSRRGTKMTRRVSNVPMKIATTLAALILATPYATAQSCIPLSGSTQCPAFNASSISTGSDLTGLLFVRSSTRHHIVINLLISPFLSFVSSREQFDTQLSEYVSSTYVQEK